jgi:plasmid stability protein
MRRLLASRIMARTTLDLDPSVLRELRRRGAREGKSMGRVASELLAGALAEPEQARPALAWASEDLGTPRVDLEDKEAVRRVLDRDS